MRARNETMKCSLCDKTVENYNPAFHHLEINAHHGVDICSSCIDKFFKWQIKTYAQLFPTSAMKKWHGKK